MMTTKDRNNLDRHLKLAAQWLKKRQLGWDAGMATQQAYQIEQRLFPSLSLLSDYAQGYIIERWPEKPWPLKVALIAALQSDIKLVFESALDKLASILVTDEADFFMSTLWLANPQDLSKEKLAAFLDSSIPSLMGEENFHQCHWSNDTMRIIALQCDWTLPAWMKASSQLKHSKQTALLRALILKEHGAASAFTAELAQAHSWDDSWQWLTLTNDPIAADLFFTHCEQVPHHLAAAALQGSQHYLVRLLQCFSKLSLAESAALAVENILATKIEWQPVLADAKTGKPLKNSPSLPMPPTLPEGSHAGLLLGQPKTPVNVANWLLSQPAALQVLAWYHLGQCCHKVLPNLSRHWTHSQWHLLKQSLPIEQKVSHAA